MKTIILAAVASALAFGVAAAPKADNDASAPVTIGAYTFDEFGRFARVQLPDGRTVEYLYDGATNQIIAVRKTGGVWDLPPPLLVACQLSDPSAMHYCLTKKIAPKAGGNGPLTSLVEELPPITVVGEDDGSGGGGFGGIGGPGGGGGEGGGDLGGGSGGGGGWTDPNCQNNCDIAFAWAAAYCAGVGLVDPPLGFACLVAETAAYTYCSYRCRNP